jgi:hypothetical protein
MSWMATRWMATAVLAAATFTVTSISGPAWAGDEKGERVAHEEYMLVLEGLEGEQLERCVAELKKSHPGVEVKVREGVLKVRGTDANAFEHAMHALRELGVPTEGVRMQKHDGAKPDAKEKKERRAKDGKRPDAPGGPSDAEIAAKLERIEQQLAEARRAGNERQVAELEQVLERVRAMRAEIAAARGAHAGKPDKQGEPRLDELRRALEQAKRELADAQREQVQVRSMQKFLSDEQGAQRMRFLHEGVRTEMGGAAPAKLGQRMEHARAALKHLKEAGLDEQAQQVERALHRMELAAQGQHDGPREVRVIEVAPARGRQVGPVPPRVAPPMPPLPPQAEGPPPSVGGVNRGPIHHRKPQPRAVAPMPPPMPVAPPPMPAPPRGGMIVVEREVGGPGMGAPGMGVAQREIEELRRQLEQLKIQLHHLSHQLGQQPAGPR